MTVKEILEGKSKPKLDAEPGSPKYPQVYGDWNLECRLGVSVERVMLIPIPDPLEAFAAEDGFEAELKSYGINPGMGVLLGEEFGLHAKVHAPAAGNVPYRRLVEFGIGDSMNCIWCRSFVELHEYLIHIAPLISAYSLSTLQGAITEELYRLQKLRPKRHPAL